MRNSSKSFGMFVCPQRWHCDSWNTLSSVYSRLRKWQKKTRLPNFFMISTASFFGSPPREPVQSVRPTCFDGHFLYISAMSFAFERMRGRPKIGCGGSSGWMHMSTPVSSRTGDISLRNQYMFSRSLASSMPS